MRRRRRGAPGREGTGPGGGWSRGALALGAPRQGRGDQASVPLDGLELERRRRVELHFRPALLDVELPEGGLQVVGATIWRWQAAAAGAAWRAIQATGGGLGDENSRDE